MSSIKSAQTLVAQLAGMVEDQWIDLETCKELLSTRIPAADVKRTLDMRRNDPKRRSRAREQYAPMWDALTTSLIEEEQLLSQEKPN